MVEKIAQHPDQEDAAPMPFEADPILAAYPNIGNSKDASIALGIPESSVRELCRTKKLRAFKCGSFWKIPKAWLLEFIERGGCLQSQEIANQGGDELCHCQ